MATRKLLHANQCGLSHVFLHELHEMIKKPKQTCRNQLYW